MIEKIVYWQARCNQCADLFPSDPIQEPLYTIKKELKDRLKKYGWMKGKIILCPVCRGMELCAMQPEKE